MLELILFSRFLESLISSTCLKNDVERAVAENYHPISVLSAISKVLVNSSDFLISSMVLGCFVQVLTL